LINGNGEGRIALRRFGPTPGLTTRMPALPDRQLGQRARLWNRIDDSETPVQAAPALEHRLGKSVRGFPCGTMLKSLDQHRIQSEKWIHFSVRCCRSGFPHGCPGHRNSIGSVAVASAPTMSPARSVLTWASIVREAGVAFRALP
jgi:hypothetical protein